MWFLQQQTPRTPPSPAPTNPAAPVLVTPPGSGGHRAAHRANLTERRHKIHKSRLAESRAWGLNGKKAPGIPAPACSQLSQGSRCHHSCIQTAPAPRTALLWKAQLHKRQAQISWDLTKGHEHTSQLGHEGPKVYVCAPHHPEGIYCLLKSAKRFCTFLPLYPKRHISTSFVLR